MTTVYLVTDGETDLYGIFSTRVLAQAWIDRQAQRSVLHIDEWCLDVADDLMSTRAASDSVAHDPQ